MRRLVATALSLVLVLLAGPAAVAEPTEPVLPPTETVTSPGTEDCSQREQPPPPVDTSENVPPGQAPPAPLPVPDPPIGGDALAGCGLVLPASARPLPPDITAAGWVVADLDTGEVLGGRDPHGRYRPASTLKLLTMLVMLENLTDLDQVVVGTETDASQEGSSVGIGPGGRYTVEQLLLFLMMGSGNDVANALARANGGDDATVADMNAAAAELNALDTRAATVSGLDGPGQMTSAYDLALIARADMALDPFPELIGTQYSQVPGWGPNEGFGIANDNKLLFNYPGAIGGKTGFTDDSGNTYVGLAERNGRRLVVTMLAGSQQPRRQWMQAASLLDWGFSLPTAAEPVGTLVPPGPAGRPGATPSSTPVAPTPTGSSAGTTVPTAPSGSVTDPVTATARTSTGAVVPAAAGTGRSSGLPGWGLAVLIVGITVLGGLAAWGVAVARRPDDPQGRHSA